MGVRTGGREGEEGLKMREKKNLYCNSRKNILFYSLRKGGKTSWV